MTIDSHLAAIDVSGPDALTLLQGQLTADISLVASQQVKQAAWLNPKGRVITMLDVILIETGYRLFVPESLVDIVMRRLGLYKLRADVDIRQAGATVSLNVTPSADQSYRTLGLTSQPESFDRKLTTGTTDLTGAHLAARIAAGLPWIDAGNTERYTAHQLNLDWSGAVSFEKGCYSGQEIVARTEHRGRIKRRAHRLQVKSRELPLTGSKIISGASEIGEVICSAYDAERENIELLALLPIADIEKPLALASGPELQPAVVHNWPASAED